MKKDPSPPPSACLLVVDGDVEGYMCDSEGMSTMNGGEVITAGEDSCVVGFVSRVEIDTAGLPLERSLPLFPP